MSKGVQPPQGNGPCIEPLDYPLKSRGNPGATRGPIVKTMTGKEGEAVAAAFLTKKGYRIVETNFKCSYGEIDLIAWHGEMLVFIEVKSRSSSKFGGPEGAVPFRKQEKISRVAMAFLQERRLYSSPCRFDVVGIVKKAGQISVALFENAFESRLTTLTL